jgi:hypothetical protein
VNVAIATVIICCLLTGVLLWVCWFYWSTGSLPQLRKQDDPLAGAKQMAANRAEYTRINREAMAAWEDACDCRPEPPPESKDAKIRRLMYEQVQRSKQEVAYGLPPAEIVYDAAYAPPPYAGPLYSNPHSPFNDYLRQQYMPKYVPTPGSMPPLVSSQLDSLARPRRPNRRAVQ